MSMKFAVPAVLILSLLAAGAAHAGSHDVFQDAAGGGKLHAASGFTCPAKFGRFDRDAVGERSPEAGSDYCTYSARDGVYGTIVLMPVRGEFDPKAMMVRDFVVLEGIGSRMVAETTLGEGPQQSLPVYSREYETAKIEAMHYRVLFACAAVGGWAVQVTVEYAEPRDVEVKDAFLKDVYNRAVEELAPR